MEDPNNPATPANNNLNTGGGNAPKPSDQKPEDKHDGFFTKISGMFSKKETDDDDRFSNIEQSIVLMAEKFSELKEGQDAIAGKQIADGNDNGNEDYTQLKKDHDELQNKFTELQEQLESTPGSNFRREPASGGDGVIKTDF